MILTIIFTGSRMLQSNSAGHTACFDGIDRAYGGYEWEIKYAEVTNTIIRQARCLKDKIGHFVAYNRWIESLEKIYKPPYIAKRFVYKS
jgi:uncharacterized protein YmfQ (DUF2313 family)